MKIKDLENNKIVSVKFLRELLLEFETEDILENWGDYKSGHLDIVYQIYKIRDTQDLSIENVIWHLNSFWGCNFEIIK